MVQLVKSVQLPVNLLLRGNMPNDRFLLGRLFTVILGHALLLVLLFVGTVLVTVVDPF
jgi:hypothetical protein